MEGEVSRQGRGCGPLPQPLLSRMDKPVLPWQQDRKLTAKREPFCIWTLNLSGSPQFRPLVLSGSRDQAPMTASIELVPRSLGSWPTHPRQLVLNRGHWRQHFL